MNKLTSREERLVDHLVKNLAADTMDRNIISGIGDVAAYADSALYDTDRLRDLLLQIVNNTYGKSKKEIEKTRLSIRRDIGAAIKKVTAINENLQMARGELDS